MHHRPTVARQISVGLLLLLVVAGIAYLGSLATIPNTEGWYASVRKAPWSPPNWVFGPAWSVLYVCIAVAGWLIWRSGWTRDGRNAARPALILYGVQLGLNALWTPVFFAGYPRVGEAAWWGAMVIMVLLIACVLGLIVTGARWSQAAAWLLVPYVLWLLFAATLNAAIISLNEPIGPLI